MKFWSKFDGRIDITVITGTLINVVVTVIFLAYPHDGDGRDVNYTNLLSPPTLRAIFYSLQLYILNLIIYFTS